MPMIITMVTNAIIVYAALILLFRMMGKRQLGDLELSELIVTVLISEIASIPISDPEKPLWLGLLPAAALLGMSLVISLIAMKSVKFRAFISGKPALLIVHGRIDQSQMRKNRLTPDELTEALRNQGYLDLGAVEYAILETDGTLNVISSPANRPVTAGQLGLEVNDPGYPFIVINNGRVLTDNLRLLGRDEAWLMAQLKTRGLSAPREVYLMTVDMADGIFLAPLES